MLQRLGFAYNEEVEQVAKPEPLERSEHSDRKRPLVFLDTNVIIGYLRGEPSAAQLFSAEAEGRIRFAVNPIVLQELLLAAEIAWPTPTTFSSSVALSTATSLLPGTHY